MAGVIVGTHPMSGEDFMKATTFCTLELDAANARDVSAVFIGTLVRDMAQSMDVDAEDLLDDIEDYIKNLEEKENVEEGHSAV